MRLLAAALLLAAAPAAAQDERAAIAAAQTRGALIYAYDQAAWHGTDDMRSKVRDPATRLAGYIADGPADAPRLIFFDGQPTPQAYYIAQFRGKRLVSGRVLGPDDDRALPVAVFTRLKALAAANIAMRQAGLRPCGRAQVFNTVVLPIDPASGAVAIYYLTPQTDRATLPLGGHYAIEVAADGKAGTPRAFMRRCMEMQLRPPPRPDGATAVGASVSHLLDPTPTELHVFSSLAMRMPLFVLTTQPTPRLWTVVNGRIDGPRPLPARR